MQPELREYNGKQVLFVDGAPFYAVAGEVHNSDASSPEYMEKIWQAADELGLNTLLLPVEVIALSALFAVALPTFSRMGLLPGHEKRDLEKLTLGQSIFPVFGLDCLLAGGASIYYSTTLPTAGPAFLVLGIVLLIAGASLLSAGFLKNRAAA